MGEMERGGDVLHGDIVGDDKLFQAGAEGFAERGIGFDPEGIGGGPDPAVGFEPALGRDDGGPDRLAGLEFFQVLGDLPVEETNSVLSGEFEQGAGPGHPRAGGCFDLLKRVWVHQNRGVIDEHFMDEALRQARKAATKGEVPVGAVLVMGDRIVAKAYNQVEELKDATAHAEVLVVTAAAGELGDWRLNEATVYVTKEPCPMCAGAMALSRVKRVVYGAADPKMGAAGGALNLLQFEGMNHRCEVRGGVRAEECRELLREFFQKQRAGNGAGGK
jgi:tRNA(adenine34) deaminase